MADDELAAALAEMKGKLTDSSNQLCRVLPDWDERGDEALEAIEGIAKKALAALEMALNLTDDWERKAGGRREYAAAKLAAGNSIPAWIAQAGASGLEKCVHALREAITSELTGKDKTDG